MVQTPPGGLDGRGDLEKAVSCPRSQPAEVGHTAVSSASPARSHRTGVCGFLLVTNPSYEASEKRDSHKPPLYSGDQAVSLSTVHASVCPLAPGLRPTCHEVRGLTSTIPQRVGPGYPGPAAPTSPGLQSRTQPPVSTQHAPVLLSASTPELDMVCLSHRLCLLERTIWEPF